VAFDDRRIAGVLVQPVCLRGQDATALGRQRRLVHLEQHPVADRLVEIGNRRRVVRIAQTRGVDPARTTGTTGTARTRATGAVTVRVVAGRKAKNGDQEKRLRSKAHGMGILLVGSIETDINSFGPPRESAAR